MGSIGRIITMLGAVAIVGLAVFLGVQDHRSRDGVIVDAGSCPISASYDDFLATIERELKPEIEQSRLLRQLDARPLSSIYSLDEWVKYRRATSTRRCERVRYLSDGLKIVGFVQRPETSGRHPAVIFARGGNRDFGRIDERTLLTMQRFVDEGFVVISSQYRGSEGSEGRDEFGGADVHDLLALAPLAQSLPEVDPDRLFLYGASRGGMEALLAARAGMPVRAIALRSPMVDLSATSRERPEMRDLFSELIPNFARDPDGEMKKRSAVAWPEQISKPVLILHATEDFRVSTAQTRRLDQELGAQHLDHQLVVYDREIHQLVFHREEAFREVLAWFRRHDLN
jgi:dipeptidyl aminopeptidase/acylaminoacyl peptidase